MNAGPPIRHALTVDVEDWYHDGGAPGPTPPESRVERNVSRLLEALAATGQRGTFFFLGEVASRFPGLVRSVAAAGHEIGSHGYHHRPLGALLRREFRDDVSRSIGVLEDTCGDRVCGYRAPYFSIKVGVLWPIETLQELGLTYDSSILAIDRPPGLELVCPRGPFRHGNGLWEVPVAVLQMLHFWHLPLASGAGLRLFPPRVLRRWIRRFEREVGPGVFYLHPWEIDPESPTAKAPGRWFLRVGRSHLPARFDMLLRMFRFGPIREIFSDRLSADAGGQ